MEVLTIEYNPNNMMEPKWGKMLVISFFFHLVIFSLILFVPQDIPTRRIGTAIYEVNLVEMPRGGGQANVEAHSKATAAKKVSASKKPAPAKRISIPKKKAKPVVVAKRTVETKRLKPKKTEAAPAKLIDQALSKIEKKVKQEEKDRKQKEQIEQAISKLESKFKGGTGKGFPGGYADPGINFSIYQMEVREKIKSNWSFPSAHLDSKTKKHLEAVVVVKVRSNGTILESRIKKRSSSAIFDQTVIKAIERSDPLPPFPEGYRKTHDEIEFTFNLSDLENE